MARDFRPKSARGIGEGRGRPSVDKAVDDSKRNGKSSVKSKRSQSDSTSSDEDEDGLLKEIRAMGGDESDLQLVRKSKVKGIERNEDDDEEEVSSSRCSGYRKRAGAHVYISSLT
jgi:hypothetical protein